MHIIGVEFVQYLKVDGKNKNSIWSWVDGRAIDAVHVPIYHIGSVPILFLMLIVTGNMIGP